MSTTKATERHAPGTAPGEGAEERDEAVWRALAHPVRRRILDELRRGPRPAGRVAELFAELTRFAVRKHLRVLEGAGLVVVEPRGRERWYHGNPVPVREIHHRWIRPFEEPDADHLLRIRQHLERPRGGAMSERRSMETAEVLAEVRIDAPTERVWKALVEETPEWWRPEFCTDPSAEAFRIEARVGGRAWEDWGDGQGQIWGIVNGVRRGSYLQIVGDSSKEWGGPHRSIMTYRLTEEGGESVLRLEHSIFGVVDEKTKASLTEGWRFLLHDCMKAYVETGKRPDLSSMQVPE